MILGTMTKKRLRRFVFCAAIGFIISVMISWVIAHTLRNNHQAMPGTLPFFYPDNVVSWKSEDWMTLPENATARPLQGVVSTDMIRSYGFTFTESSGTVVEPDGSSYHGVRRLVEFGFPFRCMYWHRYYEIQLSHEQLSWFHMAGLFDYNAAVASRSFLDGISYLVKSEYARDQYETKILPTRIHWLGMMGNTLIYALITWCFLTLCGLGYRRLFRARRRMAMGQCPRCGYSLRGSPLHGCPECGWNRPAGEGEAPAVSPQPSSE